MAGKVLAGALVALALAGCGGGGERSQADLVSEGRQTFEGRCAPCHGLDLEGTNSGPPFLDPIYAPNHHSDEAFYRAVAQGVQPHHWNFGPMPSVQISRAEVEAVIAYVRSRQREAGVTSDPSHP